MENTPAAETFETTRLLKAWSEGDETALERLVPLDDALNELATFDDRQSKIVEMRFFGGLSLEETAEAMKISTRRRAARMVSGAGLALP